MESKEQKTTGTERKCICCYNSTPWSVQDVHVLMPIFIHHYSS